MKSSKVLTINWFSTVCAVAALLVGGCGKDGASSEHKAVCYYQQDITWSNYVGYLANTSCAVSGCHVAGNSKGLADFSTYNGLLAAVNDSSFEKTVLIENKMPKGSKLNDSILTRLECWFQNGAPE